MSCQQILRQGSLRPLSTHPEVRAASFSAFADDLQSQTRTTGRERAARLTGGCHSVLPGGLVVAQGEQHGLDGADENPGQASVENDIKQEDFDCGREERKDLGL